MSVGIAAGQAGVVIAVCYLRGRTGAACAGGVVPDGVVGALHISHEVDVDDGNILFVAVEEDVGIIGGIAECKLDVVAAGSTFNFVIHDTVEEDTAIKVLF